jgi:hypothetical protein
MEQRAGAAAAPGPDTDEATITLELAIPLLEQATAGRVEGLRGEPDAYRAVEAALREGRLDEVIISTLPARVSHWLHVDPPARVRRLGVPVTVVTAKQSHRALLRSRLSIS